MVKQFWTLPLETLQAPSSGSDSTTPTGGPINTKSRAPPSGGAAPPGKKMCLLSYLHYSLFFSYRSLLPLLKSVKTGLHSIEKVWIYDIKNCPISKYTLRNISLLSNWSVFIFNFFFCQDTKTASSWDTKRQVDHPLVYIIRFLFFFFSTHPFSQL